ncbi:hypothetical protein P4123_10365 [Pseudomonas aeruginosa]|nr:hypothetical protein [Pseudomonas aeruginosa]
MHNRYLEMALEAEIQRIVLRDADASSAAQRRGHAANCALADDGRSSTTN